MKNSFNSNMSPTSTSELSESEKQFKNLVERLPDGVYKSTHDGKFAEVNNALVNMLGYSSKEELLAIDIKTDLYFHPDDRESLVLQEKHEEMGIFRLRKKDGSEIWVEDNGWYTLDDQGEVLFHEGILRDISHRIYTEQALKESEEKFKLLYEKAPVGYQSLDEEGRLLDVNETWLELLKYNKDEVLGCKFTKFLTPEYVDTVRTNFAKLKASGKIKSEFELVKKDGSVVIVQLEGRISHTPEGKFKQTHCVISDITERRKAEKLIADERILLRTLIDNIPDAVYVKDVNGRKLISNKADYEILGYHSEAEALGKTDSETNYAGNSVQTTNDDIFVIQNAQAIVNKLESFTDTKGEKRFFLTSKIPLSNESGEIIGLVGVGHDITAQKQSEQKINQLLNAIEQGPASIVITDTKGNIEFVNSKFTEISGYQFDEVKGQNPRILQSGKTTFAEYQKLWDTIKSGNEYRSEILNKKKNGELYWESILVSPIRDEEGRIINFIAIKEDITNRKKSEHEIRTLSVAIEQNPACVVITDTNGVIEYVNNKFQTLSEYPANELIGKVLRIFKPNHCPEEVYNTIWRNLRAGEPWKGEHKNRTKSRITYWESVQISPIKNQSGEITNFVVLSENISERKKMEKDLIAAKEKAEESDRLKSAFLANMSHEIRTPLNSILGFSDLLITPDLDLETRKEYANLINISGSNLLAIINDILDISKIEAGQINLFPAEFSPSHLISKIQKEYQYRANLKGIDIKLSVDPEAINLIIFSDEARISQVLTNFVSNALKFTSNGFIELGLSLTNHEILFSVKDTGIGIPEDYHEKVFDRFRQVEAAQTRKYGGIGLGLSITKNLAELLEGRIWLESTPQIGSTFFFALPQKLIVN